MGFHSLLLLFICIGVQLAEQQKIERIYQGSATSPLQYPFMASLRGFNFRHSCGGSIISVNSVLTAAHCGTPRFVVVGGTRKHGDDGYKHLVDWVKLHEEYASRNHLLNDIAIIRVVDEFSFGPSVMPIELSTATFYPPGTEATILGWGDRARSNEEYFPLQVATTRVMDEEECLVELYTSWSTLGPRICAKGDEKQSTCVGDSGGPLVIDNQLAGITSMGHECNAGGASLFTNVGLYVEWVIDNAAMEEPNGAIKFHK